MICNKCGANIPDDSVFCENCGAQLEPLEPVEEYEETPAEEVVEEPYIEQVEEPVEETYDEVEEVPIEQIAEEEEFRDIDEFREIEELESMEEVEYDEDEYEYEEDEYDYEEEPVEPIAEAEIPEEAQLPDLTELEFQETGQPEGSETEWLESFQQLEPKEEDWIEEPVEEPEYVEEELPEEYAEEEYVEEELVEEPEYIEEEIPAEPIEEEVSEAPIEEELSEEEFVEEDALAEEPAEEDAPTEEPAEEDTPTEEPAEEDAPAEEPAEEDAPAESKVEEAKEAISDGAEKVGAWLGSLGKSVHTGTGWAVDVAKEKAAKLKDEKKAERNTWSKEEEGDLDLGYDFWYRSNQPDAASRYEGMDQEEEEQEHAVDDSATTYVAVKSKGNEEGSDNNETDPADGEEGEPKKPANKLKITVIVLLIAALLGAGGVYGSKVYTENKQEDAYQASLTKAEQSVEAKDYPTAEQIYKDLLVEYPDRAELYESLTRTYIAEEKYEEAKNTLNEGIARTGKSKAYTALAEDIDALTSTEWQEPFRRVLADNEWATRGYEDVNGSCVALCDITGDKRPEMIYFTQEYYGYGILHLCVYENEKVKEITYECKNRGTQYQDAFYDVESDASGYVVYKSKTPGKFGIYESFQRGSEAWQTTNQYTLAGTDCERDSVIEACIETSYRVSDDEDTTKNNEYYRNDKEIKYKDYLNDFKAVLDDIDEVIITSENTAGDKEIWNRIMDMEEAAMTYDGAMKILDEDAR